MQVAMPEFIERALSFFSRAETNLTAISELAETKTKLAVVTSDLATTKQTIHSLGEHIAAKDASLKKQVEDHAAALAAKETEVETRAAARALTITASQGQAPIAKASLPSAGTTMKREEFAALSAYEQRNFIKANGRVTE